MDHRGVYSGLSSLFRKGKNHIKKSNRGQAKPGFASPCSLTDIQGRGRKESLLQKKYRDLILLGGSKKKQPNPKQLLVPAAQRRRELLMFPPGATAEGLGRAAGAFLAAGRSRQERGVRAGQSRPAPRSRDGRKLWYFQFVIIFFNATNSAAKKSRKGATRGRKQKSSPVTE